MIEQTQTPTTIPTMTRGGKRPGAGPPLKGTSNRTMLSLRVDIETKLTLKALASDHDLSQSEILDRLVMNAHKILGKPQD